MASNVKELNEYWTDIYFHLHYPHTEKISHQVIRILQLVEKKEEIGVNEVATYLHISHNTASEHVKRMVEKNLLIKERGLLDERKVLLHLTKVGKDVLHRNTSLDEEKLEQVMNQLADKEKEIIEQAFKILSERAKTCL
ncbi:MarR family winged helix-turn-helix transcriptional regulator [Planococcus halotolerans]|uniref:HTH-type transcriptional regulator SarZ n=1 Tax=Planococcus halotolerans TaxID=2233542 RepID=A0A365L0I8_9BACL|nr:MarR family transcriptional regulator [Planococcus halotolerans]QHJ71302.1 MarR family transcriptional regulator [Planococcus halotolerans]RAZ78937.1 MarR family transcriptional regulator [Planococcus halotolerans]